jgi:hypothetical protein
MSKKFFICGLTILGLINSSFAADITYYGLSDGYSKINSINFSDVSAQGNSYWAKPAIYQIAAFSIMSGFSSNTFSPTTSVTNEQAVTTILNATGKAKEVEKINMLVKNWSDKYIKYAMNNGLLTEKVTYKRAEAKGDIDVLKSKGVFIRDIPITREEVATLIYRAFNLASEKTEKEPIDFLDKALVDSTRVAHVDAISKFGIMVGDESGMFNPKSNLTRAEFAQIFKNCEDYLLTNLRLTKRGGVVDRASANVVEVTDDKGNTININCTGRDIPTIRKNTLSGVSALRVSDEIEYFVDTAKQVVFIRVIDEGIYDSNYDNTSTESKSKQGIVTGNSPYFYEISIKDKSGNVENYSYGAWTEIYKDGKKTNASNILQGDTVYLEFDEIGDLVVIRGVTNAVISYGTVTVISGYDVTLSMDSDGTSKNYNLRKIPVYENGMEIDVTNLKNGNYIKLYSSQSELIKAEVVVDERTAENLYKGYISEINLIQDRIILRNPKILNNDKWVSAESSFITIPLDDNMKVTYDGINIEKQYLGEKHVGKFAYIVTREDTKVLERVKSINIEFEEDTDTIVDEIRSYNSSTGLLKLYDDSRKLYIDDSTICVIDGKIVSASALEKGQSVILTVSYKDKEYTVKTISSTEKEEVKDTILYYGNITSVDPGEEVSVKVTKKFIDEWDNVKSKHTSFIIKSDTRIYGETEALTFKEFNEDYIGKDVCVIASGDEAISIKLMTLPDEPYISVGSIKSAGDTAIKIYDVTYYDFEEEDWLETNDQDINISPITLIMRNGNFARSSEIKKGQECIVIRASATADAGVVMLTD